jgi:hypothetical protein
MDGPTVYSAKSAPDLRRPNPNTVSYWEEG